MNGLVPALTGLVLGLLGVLLVRPLLARRQIVDVPNERSSHQDTTLRGGGMGLALGLAAAALLWVANLEWHLLWALLVLAFAILGSVEDLQGLSVKTRLATQIALGVAATVGAVVQHGEVPIVLVILAPVGIAAYVNATNFMDGINGITSLSSTIAFCSLALSANRLDLTEVATLCWILAGISISFVPFNFPNAQLFLGDSGSYLLGSAIVVLAFLLFATQDAALLEIAAPLAIYGADVGATLVRRYLAGSKLSEPHREHAYQRLANELDVGHTRTTLFVCALSAALIGLGQLNATGTGVTDVVTWLASIGLLVGYLASPWAIAKVRR